MVLLAGLVLCATLLPLSMTLNRAAPPHCPDARREVGDESSQLAVLAQLAQRNEELLRDLANTENGSSPTRLSPVRERPPEDAEAAAVASEPVRLPRSGSPPQLWLRMAIMSVGRKDNSEYLLRTLVSILEQLPPHDPLSAHVEVLVVNNQQPPEAHTVLTRARERFGGHARVRFATKRRPEPPLKCPGGRSKVSEKVQRQTCDLVAAINAILDARPHATHVMMMEDDWLFCPHGLDSLRYFLSKAYQYDPRWLALRVSYGFNGVVVRQADLPALQRHLQVHFERRPPDHLLFEWFSGERDDTRALAAGRSYRIYRHNLFFHIGTKSTINQPSHRFIPGCYALLYDWLLPAEVFNEKVLLTSACSSSSALPHLGHPHHYPHHRRRPSPYTSLFSLAPSPLFSLAPSPPPPGLP